MGQDPTSTAPVDPDDLFPELVLDLHGLGYLAEDPLDGITRYIVGGHDEAIRATIDAVRGEATLAVCDDDHEPVWSIRLSGRTPPDVQRLILFTVLEADHTDGLPGILRALAHDFQVTLQPAPHTAP
jgi:hypothetical protein